MDVAPQKTVRRTFDAARIVERKLRLAYGKGKRNGGKHIVIRAALLSDTNSAFIIIGSKVLIAHANLGLQIAETAGIFCKSRNGILADIAMHIVQNTLVIHVIGQSHGRYKYYSLPKEKLPPPNGQLTTNLVA